MRVVITVVSALLMGELKCDSYVYLEKKFLTGPCQGTGLTAVVTMVVSNWCYLAEGG